MFEVCWGTAAGRGNGGLTTGAFATVVFPEDCNDDGVGDCDGDDGSRGGGIESIDS